MKFLKRKIIPVAAALALMSAAGSASAAAYGYSYNNIFNFIITPSSNIDLVDSTSISRATATLNGASVITGGSNILDAPEAALGGGSGPNQFARQGQVGTYSRGDAQIVSTQFPPFPAGSDRTQAVNVAESNLEGFGTSDASGRNGSTTGLSVDFVVGSPTGTMTFAFQADPFMQVFLDTLAGPGSSATANLAMTITITDADGDIVFNWAPDGVLDSGIVGGTETADAASLNTNLSTNTLTAGNLFTYDDTFCGAPVAPGTGTTCGGDFGAFTAGLEVGTYTLTLNAVESVDLVITQQVPEPGTLALLGLGLAGLCFGSRRRSSEA